MECTSLLRFLDSSIFSCLRLRSSAATIKPSLSFTFYCLLRVICFKSTPPVCPYGKCFLFASSSAEASLICLIELFDSSAKTCCWFAETTYGLSKSDELMFPVESLPSFRFDKNWTLMIGSCAPFPCFWLQYSRQQTICQVNFASYHHFFSVFPVWV